jgi:uncharacterized surface protein with fasciclin (FAS1) repeats
MFTVFAPTNAAFEELLKDPSVAEAVTDIGFLTNVLLYHVISGKVLFVDDLKCTTPGTLYHMANGKPTRHLCQQNGKKRFQRGSGNLNNDPPMIM